MSFFDDDEPPDTNPHQARAPRPRRPTPAGAHAADHQTILVRRGVVLACAHRVCSSSCSGSRAGEQRAPGRAAQLQQRRRQHRPPLPDRRRPVLRDLATAQGKSAAQVEPQLDALTARRRKTSTMPRRSASGQPRRRAGPCCSRSTCARRRSRRRERDSVALGGLSAPVRRSADRRRQRARARLRRALPGPRDAARRAGAVANGISPAALPSSVWLRDLSWLQEGTVASRLTGGAGTGTNGTALAPGTHGHSLNSVSVGGNTLNPAPAVNNISAGPTRPSWSAPEHRPEQRDRRQRPGLGDRRGAERTAIEGVPLTSRADLHDPGPGAGRAAAGPGQHYRRVVPVPGEKNMANNKATFTAVFGQ